MASLRLRSGQASMGYNDPYHDFGKLAQFGPETTFHIFLGYGKQAFLGLAIEDCKIQIDHNSMLKKFIAHKS